MQAPLSFILWSMKYVSRFYGTGLMMKNMVLWDNACCAFCQVDWYTTYHLPICPHQDMKDIIKKTVTTLKRKLELIYTSPQKHLGIMSYIRNKLKI